MREKTILLAVETATSWSSSAVLHGTELIAETGTVIKKDHSGPLVSRIEHLVKDAGLQMEDISAVAISGGPGSFTGLRVGAGFAKGFIFGTDRKLYAVSTLETIAAGCVHCRLPICTFLDARKGEVYAAIHRWEGKQLVTDQEPVSVNPDEFLNTIKEEMVFVGDGVLVYRELIEGILGTEVQLAPSAFNVPRASVMGYLVSSREDSFLVEDPATYEPSYIRPPEAVVKWRGKEKK
jgi:tRNA threonylcarbamoyladenosine biosynthesis protein TsaB